MKKKTYFFKHNASVRITTMVIVMEKDVSDEDIS